MADGERRGGCWRWIGCSCLAVIVIAALVTVLVVVNLDRIMSSELAQKIQSTVEEGKQALVELQRIETELAAEVDARGLHLGATIDQRGRRIEISVVDPTLPDGVDPAVWARQLAVRVGEEVMPLMRLDEIEVSIERIGGGADGVRSANRYTFPIDTLPELQSSVGSDAEATGAASGEATGSSSP